MKTIACVVVENVNTPSEPLPTDAKMIVCDGTQYTVYEDGDELPVFSDDVIDDAVNP